MIIDDVARILRNVRIMQGDPTEAAIVQACMLELTHECYGVRREVRLGHRCRIDLVAYGHAGISGEAPGIGIECKKVKPLRGEALSQVERYLRFDNLEGLIFVLPKSVDLPAAVNGKPVRVLSLNAAWGIA